MKPPSPLPRPTFAAATPILAALATLACAEAPAERDPAGALVRDSAGIRIVESAAPAWNGDGWSVADSPSVVIGRREGDERYLLGSVDGAVVLRDGRIAILDGRSALIRVYSSEGEHIEDWGGRGEGPGEFSYPASIFPYRGDSIMVGEFVASSFTIMDDEGRLGRRFIPAAQKSFATEFMPTWDGTATPAESCCGFWGPLSNGAFLQSYPEMMPTAGTGTKRGSVTAVISPASGDSVESAGVFAAGTYQLGLQGSSSGFQFQPVFSMVAGPDGYFATEGDSYSINDYDASGRLRRIIRLARESRPVTDEIKTTYEGLLRESVTASSPGGRTHGITTEEMIQRILAGPYPSHLPAFVRLFADPEGNIWAQHYPGVAGQTGDAPDRWEFLVFGADGRHLGVMETPGNLQVLQVGSRFVLGKATDELGVEYVHLHRIEK